MDKQFQRGQLVTANAFGGKRLSMIVVEDCGNVVLICKPEEFERAQRENRQPISVGFHKEDIMEDAGTDAPKKRPQHQRGGGVHRSSQAGD